MSRVAEAQRHRCAEVHMVLGADIDELQRCRGAAEVQRWRTAGGGAEVQRWCAEVQRRCRGGTEVLVVQVLRC